MTGRTAAPTPAARTCQDNMQEGLPSILRWMLSLVVRCGSIIPGALKLVVPPIPEALSYCAPRGGSIAAPEGTCNISNKKKKKIAAFDEISGTPESRVFSSNGIGCYRLAMRRTVGI